jgi:NADH-quinone oxidoreductase subunit M
MLVIAASLAMMPTLIQATRTADQPRLAAVTLLAFLGVLNGLFLASDLVLMYVFWELSLIPTLVLLAAFGLDRKRAALMKYVAYAFAGSLMMLASIAAIRPLSGADSYALSDLQAAAAALPAGTQAWLFAGFAIAFMVKLPILPLHAWLIDVHRQNHPAGFADVAGTLYKVGGFGLFAWSIPLLPAGAAALQPLLLPLAAVTALWGALAATQQTDLKSFIAYGSLSHMGIVGVGVLSLTPAGMTGGMLLLAAQMLSTGALFLLAGMLHARRGTFEFKAFGGLGATAPALTGVTTLTMFAFIGVPGLSNFPGEFLALMGAFTSSAAWGTVAVVSVVAAGVYGVNALHKLFLGGKTGETADLNRTEWGVLAFFLAGILWFGVNPGGFSAAVQADAGPEAVAISHALNADAGRADVNDEAERQLDGMTAEGGAR